MPQVYVVTINNRTTSDNFRKSVLRPPFYWGLRRGKGNNSRWAGIEAGDVIIFKFSEGFICARIIGKRIDSQLAAAIWGNSSAGFEMLLELETPYELDLQRDKLSEVLGDRHPGMQRVTHARLQRAYEKFGQHVFEESLGIAERCSLGPPKSSSRRCEAAEQRTPFRTS